MPEEKNRLDRLIDEIQAESRSEAPPRQAARRSRPVEDPNLYEPPEEEPEPESIPRFPEVEAASLIESKTAGISDQARQRYFQDVLTRAKQQMSRAVGVAPARPDETAVNFDHLDAEAPVIVALRGCVAGRRASGFDHARIWVSPSVAKALCVCLKKAGFHDATKVLTMRKPDGYSLPCLIYFPRHENRLTSVVVDPSMVGWSIRIDY